MCTKGLPSLMTFETCRERQFKRLSEIEQEIIFWLAINREPSFCFSPVDVSLPSGTGLILVSGSQDETIKLWNPITGDCLKTLLADRLCEGMNIPLKD